MTERLTTAGTERWASCSAALLGRPTPPAGLSPVQRAEGDPAEVSCRRRHVTRPQLPQVPPDGHVTAQRRHGRVVVGDSGAIPGRRQGRLRQAREQGALRLDT